MTDITERLRSLYVDSGTNYVSEAADLIDRLRAHIKTLEAQPVQSFGEKHPRNPNAKCKCEHWQACIDCHPTYTNVAQPVQPARQPWEPYLSDRADGVRGRYAIARWNPRGYREVWSLWSHRWASASEDVLTLEKAESLLQAIIIPTAQPALPLTADELFASDALMALNANYGMRMDELMAIVRVIEAAISIKETP